MPRVAVVLPFRDPGPFFEAALDSLAAQTLRDWTALLVDDGSTDGSVGLARRAAERDPRFRLLRSPGRGLVAALNAGVEAARATGAPLLARFDADDLCAPERFAAQAEALESGEADVVDSRVRLLRDDGPVPGGMRRYAAWQDGVATPLDFDRECLVDSPVCHPAATLRMDRLSDGPLYRDGDFPEDYELWLRLRRRGLRFRKLEPRLLTWRDRADRATRTDPRYRGEAMFRVKWEHLLATELAGRPRVVVWGAKKHGRRWIRALVAGGHELAGVVDIDPRAIGTERHGVAVVGPDGVAALRPELVLVAVGSLGARAQIEGRLAGLGCRVRAVAGLG